MKNAVLAIALLLAASVAQPQSPAPAPPVDYGFPPADFKRGESLARGPEMRLAIEAAETALAACARSGFKVAAVVVNANDEPIAVLRADGALRIAVESAMRKAFVVIRTKQPSAAAAERVKGDSAFAFELAATQRALPVAGALPITVGENVIGAIGVGGAPPPGANDEACARAGLHAIEDRVK